MIFTDRRQAGDVLARKLQSGGIAADIVVGIARGGVVIANRISKILHIPLAVLRVQKIVRPTHPEFAIGAFVPNGQTLNVKQKAVILADDGIATGETMKAAISWLRTHEVAAITLAVPVAPVDIAEVFVPLVDRVCIVETPTGFTAVGAWYKNFTQLTDTDVIKLLA